MSRRSITSPTASRGRTRRLAAPIAMALGVVAVGLLPAAPAAAAGPTWTVESTTAPYTLGYAGLSCPASGTCLGTADTLAEISLVKRTTDGGATWSSIAAMPPAITLGELSCTSVSDCVAIDTAAPDVVVTTDGWTSWKLDALPSAITSITSITCPSASFCAASGTDAFGSQYLVASTNGGATWSAHVIPLDTSGTNFGPSAATGAVGCASETVCLVGGQIAHTGPKGRVTSVTALFRTTDGGARWTTSSLPGSVETVTSVVCPNPTRCYATGNARHGGVVLRSGDAGAAWAFSLQWGDVPVVEAITCVTGSVCEAVGGNPGRSAELFAIRTTSASKSWSKHAAGHAEFGGGIEVACASSATCTIAGTFANTNLVGTSDGGTTWAAQDVESRPSVPEQVACPAVDTCEAVGVTLTSSTLAGFTERTTDDGATWQHQTLPADIEEVLNVTCPTVMVCFESGASRAGASLGGEVVKFLATSNGGTTWTESELPDQLQYVQALTCATALACVLLGDSDNGEVVLHTADAGSTWTAGTLPNYPSGVFAEFYGVSCASASTCEAVGVASFNDGFSNVATFISTTNSGATWSPYSIQGEGEFSSSDLANWISCSSTTTCVAAGENENVFSGFGSGTSSPAVTVAAFDTTDAGQVWNEEFSIGAEISAISNPSCVSNGWCEMVGSAPVVDSAYALTSTNGGATWSSSAMPTSWLESLSVGCAAQDSCVSVGLLADGGLGVAAIT